MRPRLALFVVLLLAPFLAPGVAHAQPQDAQPLDRLLPEIRRNVPGQFLDAQGINRNGAPGYRLKWLTPEGRVIERDVDARTGRMMGPDRPNFNRPNFNNEGFGAREPAPRGNFRSFGQYEDEGGDARFGDRGFPPPRFGNQDRFNRPGFGRGDGETPRRGFGRARGQAPQQED